MTTARQAFLDTEASMNDRLVERSTFVRCLLLSLVGQMNIFALGTPGIAKTLAATTLRDHIVDLPDNGYFWRLLTKFTAPQELFGPPDLLAMESGVWRHVTDNTMVDARIALLDEAFKANSAILNSMLTILNEGIFHNDKIVECPLWTAIALSNEMPQGEELNALADRLDFWLIVEPIQSSSGFVKMLAGADEPVTPTLTMAQIEQAQREAATVQVGDDVLQAMLSLRVSLAKENVFPTDRRFAKALKVIRSAAWLADKETASIEDMRDLRHTLWTSRDHKSIVDTLVFRLAAPHDAEAVVLRENVAKFRVEFTELMSDNEERILRNSKQVIGLHDKINRAKEELEALRAQVPEGQTSEIMDDIGAQLDHMDDVMLREIFHVTDKRRKALGSGSDG